MAQCNEACLSRFCRFLSCLRSRANRTYLLSVRVLACRAGQRMQCHRSSVGGGSACGHRRAAAPPAQLPARPCRPQLDVLLAAAQPRNGNGNGLGPSTSQPARGDALRVSSAAGAPGSHRDSGSSSPEALNLAFESDKKNKQASGSGLRRAPLGGGVKTATSRFHLPSPQVAVRNLVEIAQYAHLCTVMSDMHHRRAGYPFGTLVDFATDGAGAPHLALCCDVCARCRLTRCLRLPPSIYACNLILFHLIACRLPHLLPLAPGHPRAQPDRGQQVQPGGADAGLVRAGQRARHHFRRRVPGAT